MKTISKLYRGATVVNIYLCSFLVIFGCLSNLISLMVFWHSKHKKPKIGARDYLTILTIVNSVFLVSYWYSITGHVIISYYEDEISSANFLHKLLNLKNNNTFMCKLVNYSQAVTKCLSTLLTLAFTLERTLAIYFPLKFRHYKQAINLLSGAILFGIFFFSFSISIDSALFYQAYEYNVTFSIPSFSILSVKACGVPNEEKELHNKVTFYVAIFSLVIPFMLIIVANAAIVNKLRHNKKNFNFSNTSTVVFFSKKFSEESTSSIVKPPNVNKNVLPIQKKLEESRFFRPSITSDTSTNPSLSDHTRSFTMQSMVKTATPTHKNTAAVNSLNCNLSFDTISFLNNSEDYSCSFKNARRIAQTVKATGLPKRRNFFSLKNKAGKARIVIYKPNFAHKCTINDAQVKSHEIENDDERRNNSWLLNCNWSRRFSDDNVSLLRAKSKSMQDFHWHCANKKIYSTKILIFLTSCYILLNIPHFIDVFLMLSTTFQAYLNEGVTENKYIYHILKSVADIFYLGYFSISGLLLVSSGKIYRRHLYGLTVKMTGPLKKLRNSLLRSSRGI